MICEKCQKNEATCCVMAAVGRMTKPRNFCRDCFEANSPGAKEATEAVLSATCEYCGGQPCAGGTDFLALITGVQKSKFMCMPCSMEHHRFVQQQMMSADAGLSQEAQLAAIRRLREEVDEHMKRVVAGRRKE